jgi:hypothetical protein
MLKIGLISVLVLSCSAQAIATQWVDGRGQRCDLACEAQGANAYSSGTYRSNGEEYYICAGQAEGDRPGYNLAPDWADGCYVGVGGQEIKARLYKCLCDSK